MTNQELFNKWLPEINRAIASKKSFWSLGSLSYLDYDDISQEIRLHFLAKIHLYDPNKGAFFNWACKLATHRIKNLQRDHYYKIAPPCQKCPFNNGGNFCAFTASGAKDSSCKSFSRWSRLKKNAYELKVALPIEDYDGSRYHQDCDLERGIIELNDKIKDALSERQYLAYKLLYLDGLGDAEVVDLMNFKETKESGRVAGYRQLSNLKKQIYKIAQSVIKEVDF